MIAVAAHSAAITAAWAISTGCIDRARTRVVPWPVLFTRRFCQPIPVGSRCAPPIELIHLRAPLCNTRAMTAPVHASLGADLLSVVARLNRLATQRVALPIPGAQARLLSTIEDLDEARISELASVDHCSQPTMTTQVRRLEDAGLTTRTPDPQDARAVLIRITDKGVHTLDRVRRDRAAAIDPELDRLSPEDRRTLADAVEVLRRC